MENTAETVVIVQEPEKLIKAGPSFAETMEVLDRLGWNSAPLEELRTAPLGSAEDQRRFVEAVIAEEHFFESVILEVVWGPYRTRGSERFHHPCWEQVDRLRVSLYLLRTHAPAEVTGRWLNETVQVIENLDPALHEVALELIVDLLLAQSPSYLKTVEEQWDNQAAELWIRLIHRQQRPIISQDDPLQTPTVLVGANTRFQWERHMNFFLGRRNHWGDPRVRQPREVIFDRRLDWFRANLFSYEDRAPYHSELELMTKDQPLSTEDRGILLRDALNGYRDAEKPEPVKAWAQFLLESLEMSDDEIVGHSDELVPLLFRRDSTSLSGFGPVLAEKGADEVLPEVLAACLTLAGRATRIKVLKAAGAREPIPSPEILEQCRVLLEDALAMDEHPTFARAVDRLSTAWGISIEEPAQQVTGDATLWQDAPVVWQVSPLEPSEASLTELAAGEIERFGPAIAPGNHFWSWLRDVDSERFTDALVRSAHADLEATKTSLAGVPRASKSLEGIREWVKGLPAAELRRLDIDDRQAEMLTLLGTVPVLLSTPDRQDLTIGTGTVLERLAEYSKVQSPVGLIDLAVALLRLRGDRGAVLASLRSCPLPLTTARQEEGATVAEVFSTLTVKDSPTDVGWNTWKVSIDEDTAAQPRRFAQDIASYLAGRSGQDFLPSTAERAFRRLDYTYRSSLGTGLPLRQLARSAVPFTPAAAINFLAALSNLHTREAETGWTALSEAWDRGLLLPGVPDIAHLGWHTGPPQRLGSVAKALRDMAELGMLALAWPLLDDLAAASARQDKPITGTPDLLKVIQELLPHVEAAVVEGKAGASQLELPGVRELATRRGRARAITLARAISDRLTAAS